MANVVQAGPFATAGEQRAAEELAKLPKSWIIVCNKTLPTTDGRSYEIDFIVIGENWIFILDEKSWRGRITGNDQQWVRNDGSAERSPLTKVDYVAKIVAGHVRWSVPALQNEQQHFVRGGVLLSASTQFPQVKDPRARDGIFLLSNVCQRLKDLDSSGGGSSLVMQNHGYIRKSFIDLTDRPETPAQINDTFKIEDATTIRPGVRLLQARLIEGDEPRSLMVYDLGKDPLHAQDLRTFYLHEFKALQELRTTGAVPDVKDPFLWSDDFLVVPIVPPPGKSLSSFPLPATRDELIQEMQIAVEAFKTLAHIHQEQIIHRAINPHSIYILAASQGRRVMFTNFYAARMGNASIAISLDALAIEDPYVAPELAGGYGFASAASDTFSLALVFLERWSAEPLATIRPSVNEPIALPDLRARWSTLPPDVMQELGTLFRSVLCAPTNTSRPLPQQIARILSDNAHRLRVEMNIDEGKMLDKRYQVLRLLGQGAMAATYLALDTLTEQHFATKHFLRPSDYGQAIREFNALYNLKSHPNLPRINHVNTPENEVHIIMEYIPGTLLSDVEQEFPWPIERWWSFAQGLLNALEVLENNHLLHRDIKPENIILHEEDNRPVLIDFGFATPKDITRSAAGTPLYLPPEAYTTAQPPASMDRYAAAVVLFKVLTGQLPFSTSADGQTRIVRIPTEITDEKVVRLAKVLLRPLAPDPAERPASASELRLALQNAMRAISEPTINEHALGNKDYNPSEEKINPWVENLRGLYRNSESGNADNRGLDSNFVRETYVETALDKVLLPALFQYWPSAIFLSGNPGDGKTAFLEKVQENLQRRGAHCTLCNDSGWEWTYEGHIFRSCYDASEAHKGQSADEQLTAKLAGLEGSAHPQTALTVLIAINDGRLEDYFERYRDRFPWLADQVKKLRNQETQEQHTIWVIDLKRRTFVNLPESEELSIFQEVLERLVDEDRWQICKECAAQHICPIRNNALAMTRARVTERLEYLLLLTHLSQQRHITMRDLRSALAYLITGNKDCADIHTARHKDDGGASLIDHTYWQIAFASAAQPDALLNDFAGLDPARFANPRLDRFLHFHRTAKDADQRKQLFIDKNDLAPQRFLREDDWLDAVKRRLYFDVSHLMEFPLEGEASFPTIRWQTMLPYQYANLFIEALIGQADPAQVRALIAQGLLRSDDIIGKVPIGHLSIKVNASEKQQLVVLKQFPLSQFRLRVLQPLSSKMIETIPASLLLEHVSGTPRLEITLDLFELLMRLAHGLQPGTPEFVPLLEDLAIFKGALLLQETRDLVLIESRHKVHHITQRDGKIVRLPVVERV